MTQSEPMRVSLGTSDPSEMDALSPRVARWVECVSWRGRPSTPCNESPIEASEAQNSLVST